MPSAISTLPSDYAPFLEELKARVRTAQLRASVAANSEMVMLYWSIGRDILDRQQRAGWVRRSLTGLRKT